MSKPERSYFAVADPRDATRIIYWYRCKRGRNAGELHPWPPGTTHYTLRAPEHLVKMERGPEREKLIREWFDEIGRGETFFANARRDEAAARQAIENDPVGASNLFAKLNMKCCCCGKDLSDEKSTVLGIGPECRRGISQEVADIYVDAVGHVHAAAMRPIEPSDV